MALILGLLIYGVGWVAEGAGETSYIGIPNRLFFGAIGMVLVIYVALSFSKFMFKNLPSGYEESKDDELEKESWKAAGKASEIKYGAKKEKASSQIEKYYSFGKK